MRDRSQGGQLDSVSEIVERAPSQHFWIGTRQQQIASIIEGLPIALPQGGRYLFYVKGQALFISNDTKGISSYRPTDTSKVASVELSEDGVHVYLKGRGGIKEIVLLRERVSIPADASTFGSLIAPVDLLDEYADLKNKSKRGPLSQSDFARRELLLELIGKEYEKQDRSRVVSSRRSIPESDGESRSGGCRNVGG